MIKQTAYPTIGVYYCVPDVKKDNWTIIISSERNAYSGEYSDKSEADLAHANLYYDVVVYFKKNFKIDISDIGRKCLPRGRVIAPDNKNKYWTVLHGDDFQSYLKYQIIDEFGLNAVNAKWKHIQFEEMDKTDKNNLIKRAPFMSKMFK